MINKASIIHIMNKSFVFAIAPSTFVIRLKAAKGNLKNVFLCYVDKYMVQYHRQEEILINQVTMNKVASDEIYDYFEATLHLEMIAMRYYFELQNDEETIFFGSYRFFNKRIQTIDLMFDAIIKVHEHEIFNIPSWAKGAVIYQIFPDRFARKDQYYNHKWNQAPIYDDTMRGGNIEGIIAKLDYLKDLGIDLIYLNPIFLSPSSHKYDTADYFTIDPSFGDLDTLKRLVDAVHAHNMRIILDGVFNHTGLSFFAFKDILENQEKSKYKDWYYIASFPIQIPHNRSTKPNYLSFAYFGGMPKLNTENKEVREYIFKIVDYYMKEFKIDGWRLDVADEIPHDFWRYFRKRVKKNNPEAIIIGEVWYDASTWLEGDQYDSVMNYLLREALIEWLGTRKLNASGFLDSLSALRGRLHPHAYSVMTNLIDSHDTERFLHTVHEDKDLLRIALAVIFSLNGMPLIYYGDEIGMTGGNDPDCRRGMIWDPSKQDLSLFAYYKKLISLRKKYRSLYEGDIEIKYCNNDDNVCAYLKKTDDEEILIILNTSNDSRYCENIPVGIDLITSNEFNGTINKKSAVIIKIK